MKRLPPFHPLLLSIYPVAALLASNAAQVRPQVALRAALLSLVLGLVVYACLRWIVRDTGRAALLTSLALVLFFTYGHVYGLVEGQQVLGVRVGRHLVLVVIWFALLAGGGWAILRRVRAVSTWNLVLNGSAAVLLVMVLVQLAPLALRKDWLNAPSAASSETAPASLNRNAARPDVYYIILDAYGREDVLRERYGFDNRPFLDSLRELGFVIPECTQSNYANTVMSVSSAFYMQPLEGYSDLIARGDQERDWVTYQGYLRDNPVRRNFASLGYRTVAFETGYWWGEISDADYYIVPNDNPLDSYNAGYEINEFEVMFLRTTLLRIASEAQTSLTARLFKDVRRPEQRRYDRVNFSLDQLAQVPSLPGPKFVYAHIVAPHPPFVYGPDGEYTAEQPYVEVPGYPNAVAFLNRRVLAALEQIIAKSTVPPIIILQGDHGYHGWPDADRVKILNAYYLPDGGAARIYPIITPINTFRVIFDQYFAGSYGLAPDFSRFSDDETPYEFTDIPGSCKE